jgi:hypothetical protein
MEHQKLLIRWRRISGRMDAGTFLLGGTRALPGACVAGSSMASSCAAVALVCSVGRGGTKRACAAVVVLPASAPPPGLSHGAAARRRRRRRKVKLSRKGSVGCRRARPSPGLRRRPRGDEDWAVGRRGAGGSFSAGLFRACVDRCRALKPEPKF